ncbi:hypothetical protein QUF90_03960 [Desulfococcaceae bacterium HSG9]|nr:hypothetical protein [Desulfococcaceae bacterium HSG9]
MQITKHQKSLTVITKSFNHTIYCALLTALCFFILCTFLTNAHALRYKDDDSGHDFILVGIGVFRQNLTSTEGDEIIFDRSDQGLPGEYSNRSRFSLYGDGVIFHDYNFRLTADYDEEYPDEDFTFLLQINRDKHSLTIGDHETGIFEDTVFTAMDKRIRGVTLHGEIDKGSVTLMAGAIRGESATDAIPADGTSGPYRLEEIPVVTGSERVRIEIRDRSETGRVIRSSSQSRGQDYVMDYDNGEITFQRPVASEDFRGNPTFIVVNYQYDAPGSRFTRAVWGSRAVITPTEDVRIGATWLADGPYENSLSGDIYEQRRQIFGSDINVRLTDRYRIEVEAAQSDSPSQEDSASADALRINIDTNPLDPLHVYGRYWKTGRDFLTFGNSDLSSENVIDEVENEEPFEFKSTNLEFDLDPNINANLGVDEESYGLSAAYQLTDFNTVSAGFRQNRDNIPEDSEEAVNTTRNLFASLKHIHPDDMDYILGTEMINAFDDASPRTSDTETSRILGGIRDTIGNYAYTGDVLLQGAYQYEKFDDRIDDENDNQSHDIIGRVDIFPYRELSVYFEQAERFLYEDQKGEFTERTDISTLGLEGRVNRYIDTEITAKYRLLNDLTLNRVEEEEQVYTVRWTSLPFDTLKTRFKIEYRNLDYKLTGRTDEKLVFGSQVFWNALNNLLATVKYSHEIDTVHDPDTSDETFNYDDLMLRLDYKIKDRWSVFTYYRIENDEVETEPLTPAKTRVDTLLLGTKYKMTDRIDVVASYKEKKLENDVDDTHLKYFLETGYKLNTYLTVAVGYEHFKSNPDYEDAYEADVLYLSLIGKL